MKKIFVFATLFLFVLSGLGASGTYSDLKNQEKVVLNNPEQLDQFQETMTEAAIPIGSIKIPENPPVYIQVAQSFIPSLNVILRVELYIGKNSTATLPLIVSIREELTEPDITSVELNPADVPTESYNWVSCDFNDVALEVGKTYYIVTLTENITDNFYAWGANNISESYPNGCMWISLDEGDTWSNESLTSYQSNPKKFVDQGFKRLFDENVTWDMVFRTYGRDNILPDAPNINGETNGKAGKEYEYIISSSDSDGDELYVEIDWGDNTTSGLLGPYTGSFEITQKHTWSEKDTYTITARARDPFGWGPEGTLKVTMPKNKALFFHFYNNWLIKLYQNIFPILSLWI